MDIQEQLIRDEGWRKFPYRDTVGKITIGVGRNLTDDGMSDDEVRSLLGNDIKRVIEQLTIRLPYFQGLDEVRQGVLINMCFNLGFSELSTFHDFLLAVYQSRWDDAATAMLASKWAKEVGERATRLATQIKIGEWQ